MSTLGRKSRSERSLVIGFAALCLAVAAYNGRELIVQRSFAAVAVEHQYLLKFIALQSLIDVCAWLAAASACFILARLTLTYRQNIPFGLAGYLVLVTAFAYGFRRLLQIDQFSLDSKSSYASVQALSTIIAGVVSVLALSAFPLLRRILNFRTMVSGEEDASVRAAEADLERTRLMDSITYMAHHDGLTSLPNRLLLRKQMDAAIVRAKANGKRLAVLMVDVDKFKRINDSLGHAAGDILLRTIAERLAAAMRRTDMVARVGGDEFVVMLEDLESDWDAMQCAVKILKTVQQEVAIPDQAITVTVSIGICLFPDFGVDSADLLRNADVAMYEVKKHGMNGIQIYSDSIIAATRKSLQMERELRYAIESKQLELYYQPQVDGQSGVIVGVEALLRWNHPKRGMISPLEFIGIAEDTGLIIPIGEWVLRQGCTQIAALRNRLGKRLSLAVNLSSRQFREKGLATVVQDALQASGLPGEDLQLELTESTLMSDCADTLAQLRDIRRLGVQLAIDDFGTGFSNFQYILNYQVDCLKIDRSFVSKCPGDATAAAVVRAIIAMAHSLGMRVVAEGVETTEQQAFLLLRHCDRSQGYLFDRPMSLHALEHRLLQSDGNGVHAHLKDDRLFVGSLTPATPASYGETNGNQHPSRHRPSDFPLH